MIKDHIAYRTSTLQLYEQRKDKLRDQGDVFIKESMVNGRPISIRKPKIPVHGFPYIELQAPRDDELPMDGQEHTAYVVEDLDEHYQTHTNDPNITTKPIKQYGGIRYYKIHNQLGEEIEYREQSIAEGQ